MDYNLYNIDPNTGVLYHCAENCVVLYLGTATALIIVVIIYLDTYAQRKYDYDEHGQTV